MSYPGNCVWKSEIEEAGEKYFICFARSEMMESAGMHGNFLLLFPYYYFYYYYVLCFIVSMVHRVGVLEMSGAAHHSNPRPCLARWPCTYPTPSSFRQRTIRHARWIDTFIGRKANTRKPLLSSKLDIYGVGAACTLIVRQTSGEAHAIGEYDSYASRLRSLEEFFFVLYLLA